MTTSPESARSESNDRGILSDRRSLFVFASILIAEIWTLSRLEGYQLADSVEYMDRAWDFARGNGIGPDSPRSFAFSGLLLPIFAVAEWLGLQDFKPVVLLLRCFQMGVGLLTVSVVFRTAARLYSREAAWACSLLMGLSPVFLRYTIAPLSGPLAMLFMALVFEALFAPANREKRANIVGGLRAGCWLGLGLLAAYKTLLVAGPLLVVALLADRFRRLRFWLGLGAAFAGFILAQCLLDLAIYDEFGSTLKPYLGSNVGGIIARILRELGFTDAGAWVYATFIESGEMRPDHLARNLPLQQLQPKDWYFREAATQLFAWPTLALIALGMLQALRRPGWVRTAITFTLLANICLMSMKGAKSFRLWLPLLPLLALAAGDGLTALLEVRGQGIRRWAPRAGVALLLLGLVWGVQLAHALPLQRYGDFWRAMDTVVQRAKENNTPVTVASSYHWATLFRSEENVELIKLSYDLDNWASLGEPAKERVLAELSGIDFLITHGPAIGQDPRLMEVVGNRYRIHEVYWGTERAADLGPIYLLVSPRPELPLRGRKFFVTQPINDERAVEAARKSIQHPSELVIERGPAEDPSLSISFMGWKLEPVGDRGDLAWLTYYWWARKVDGQDYLIRDRITDTLGREAWNNSKRGHGVYPTSRWTENSLLSESYLLPVPHRTRRFGGRYAHGQWIPAELYLSIHPGDVEEGAADDAENPLTLTDASGRVLEAPRPDEPASRESYRPLGSAGRRWNRAGMIQIGADWLPVPEDRLFPNDGGPP